MQYEMARNAEMKSKLEELTEVKPGSTPQSCAAGAPGRHTARGLRSCSLATYRRDTACATAQELKIREQNLNLVQQQQGFASQKLEAERKRAMLSDSHGQLADDLALLDGLKELLPQLDEEIAESEDQLRERNETLRSRMSEREFLQNALDSLAPMGGVASYSGTLTIEQLIVEVETIKEMINSVETEVARVDEEKFGVLNEVRPHKATVAASLACSFWNRLIRRQPIAIRTRCAHRPVFGTELQRCLAERLKLTVCMAATTAGWPGGRRDRWAEGETGVLAPTVGGAREPDPHAVRGHPRAGGSHNSLPLAAHTRAYERSRCCCLWWVVVVVVVVLLLLLLLLLLRSAADCLGATHIRRSELEEENTSWKRAEHVAKVNREKLGKADEIEQWRLRKLQKRIEIKKQIRDKERQEIQKIVEKARRIKQQEIAVLRQKVSVEEADITRRGDVESLLREVEQEEPWAPSASQTRASSSRREVSTRTTTTTSRTSYQRSAAQPVAESIRSGSQSSLLNHPDPNVRAAAARVQAASSRP